MADQINKDNCRVLLAAFMKKNAVSAPAISKAMGCSHATLGRLLLGESLPTTEFMKQAGVMMAIGHKEYRKLSAANKEKISEKIGTAGGTAVGFGSISAAISAAGVGGLSAAGITSGLAGLGAIVGGTMVAGVAVAAAIPIAAGLGGYGVIRGVKWFFTHKKINNEDLAARWEKRP